MADALVLGFALKIEGGEFQFCSCSTDFYYKKDCIKRQIQKEYKTETSFSISVTPSNSNCTILKTARSLKQSL